MPEDFQQHNRRSYDTEVAIIKERVDTFITNTVDYRKNLCLKLDRVLDAIASINSRLDKLPCDARKPMWTWVERNIYAIWGAIGLMIIPILVEWIKGK